MLLGFDFYCTQPVPFYQHLCNLYVSDKTLSACDISIQSGYLKGEQKGQYRYRIEAQGTQAELESLAENIALDFLLSAHLIQANITPLESPSGNKQVQAFASQITTSNKFWKKSQSVDKAIYEHTHLDYCQRCTPIFGDNQSPKFGEFNLECPYCQGHQAYLEQTDSEQNITTDQIQTWAQALLADKTVELTLQGELLTLSRSLDSFHCSQQNRPTVIICNPNTLADNFKATHEQVITLSCLEKPSLTLPTQEKIQEQFANIPSFDVRFAYSRVLIILTEYLRQKGIDWIYYQTNQVIPKMAFINQQWVYQSLPYSTQFHAPETLHDQAQSLGYQAQTKKDLIEVELNTKAASTPFDTLTQAHNALYATQLAKTLPNKNDLALLFFSEHFSNQIITSNQIADNGRIKKDSPTSALVWPTLPTSGVEIIQQLRASIAPSIEGNLLTQHTVVDKYQHVFPDRFATLADLTLINPTDNTHSLFVIAATILGLYQTPENATSNETTIAHANQQAIDRFINQAQQFSAKHSPRVDFPKVDNEGELSTFDWCQTFKSLMSFCLAEKATETEHSATQTQSDILPRLAYGFMDSLADEITTWIEQFDQKVGIEHILLAGADLQYAVFAQRLIERLSSNYQVHMNPQLDLEGANLSVGALYLPQRRL